MEHVTGPMGSDFYRLDDIPRHMVPRIAAAFDSKRIGRRMAVDAVRGVIAWMSPSSAHAVLGESVTDVIKMSTGLLGLESRSMRDTRWKRHRRDPDGTGLEADAAFYVGKNAEAWYAAAEEGDAAILAFEAATPPDLVVEIEVTNLDEGKPEHYAVLGVTEMWQVTRHEADAPPVVHILDLQAAGGLQRRARSRILAGLEETSLAETLEIASRRPSAELEARLESVLGVKRK